MTDEIPQLETISEGEGWAAAPLEALGERYGFRKIRAGLGVSEFGANALVFPPRYEGSSHFHDEQQELYVVLEGIVEFDLDEDTVRLGPGGCVRVDAPVVRRLRNVSHEDAVILIVGGAGGYVGRDGRLPEGETRGGRPLDA
jgi:mannose-6-phosphate isomerase-like protein (cupin superfamily)